MSLLLGGRALGGIALPSSVTMISSRAFEDCEALSVKSLPSSLETMGYHAFKNCTSLTEIEIPKTLSSASEYLQLNPLVSAEDGTYAWDVPEGLWQVKAEKEGYESVSSEWLPVPPPQTEVNLAMKKVTVTATANDGSGAKASYKITVMKHAVKSIKLKTSKKTVKAGKSVTITAMSTDGTNKKAKIRIKIK